MTQALFGSKVKQLQEVYLVWDFSFEREKLAGIHFPAFLMFCVEVAKRWKNRNLIRRAGPRNKQLIGPIGSYIA